MPEMSVFSGKRKVPMSRCSRPKIPPTPTGVAGVAGWTVSHPASAQGPARVCGARHEVNEDKDDKDGLELVNVLTLQ